MTVNPFWFLMNNNRVINIERVVMCVAYVLLVFPKNGLTSLLSPGASFDFMSVTQDAGIRSEGGSYGEYRVLKIFSNPARLSAQNSDITLGFSSQNLFEGSMDAWAVGSSWKPAKSAFSGWSFAVIASGYSIEPFNEVDYFGDKTGDVVTPEGMHVGLTATKCKGYSGLGVTLHLAQESFGNLEGHNKTINGASMDIGAEIHLIDFTAGAALRGVGLGTPVVLNMGAWGKSSEIFSATAVSAEINLPITGALAPYGSTGISYSFSRFVSINGGLTCPGRPDMLDMDFGLGVRNRNVRIDYGFTMAIWGMGSSHRLSLGWDLNI